MHPLADVVELDPDKFGLPAAWARLFSQAELRALMAWPSQPEIRRNFLAYSLLDLDDKHRLACDQARQELMVEICGENSWVLQRDRDEALELVEGSTLVDRLEGRCDLLDLIESRYGGFRSLLTSQSYPELLKRLERDRLGISIAGIVLGFVYTMHVHHNDEIRGGASVKKAIHLAVETNRGGPFAANSKRYRTEWRDRKSVAHLCAAYSTIVGEENTLSEDEILDWGLESKPFLKAAFLFQDFANRFIPIGQASPLIPSDEMILLPNELRSGLDEIDFSVTPFSETQLKVLREYRAPAPY